MLHTSSRKHGTSELRERDQAEHTDTEWKIIDFSLYVLVRINDQLQCPCGVVFCNTET